VRQHQRRQNRRYVVFNAIVLYAADHNHYSNLDRDLNAATYAWSAATVGTASDGKFQRRTDVFFGGVHADVFNPPTPGCTELRFGRPGNETVIITAQSGSDRKLSGVGYCGAANGDILHSIENLRGTASNARCPRRATTTCSRAVLATMCSTAAAETIRELEHAPRGVTFI